MASIYVQVGNDVIEFPEGTTDEQIEKLLVPQAQVTPPSSGFLMGLKDPITGGAQMLPRALAGVTSGFGAYQNPVSEFFSSEAQRVDELARAEEQAYQQQRQARGETGFDVPRLAGNVINPATIVPATRAAQLVRGAGYGATAQAVAGGAVSGAMQPVTGEGEFAPQKAQQIGVSAVTAPLGEKIVAGAGRVLKPLVSKAEQTMRDLGITPTIGQTLGGQFKSIEEFAQNLHLIGSSIENARQRVLFDFNKGVINKALNKVKDKLPEDVIGRDAINYASEQVSNQYDDVLSKMSFDLDFATTSNILSALSKKTNLSPSQRQEVAQTLNDIVLGKFSGQKMDGQTFKGIESDLRKKASNYMNSSTASERDIGEALGDVLGVMKKELYFQNPKQTPKLRRIDSAYADLSVINIAAANSGAPSGVFTPKQFSTAVRQSDMTRRKSAFAKGKAKSQEISDAAVEVLGDQSRATLEGRVAASTIGGLGMFSQPQIGIPLVATVPTMYSPAGQRALDMLLRSRPELMKQAGGMLTGASPQVGAVLAPSVINQYNRAERMPPQLRFPTDLPTD
jgi:hypothetical protein